MSQVSRLMLIKERLNAFFSPSYLEVTDESEQHLGHQSHQGGNRHFAISIRSDKLNSISRVAAHQKIYALFADMMPDKIHALRIKIMS